jgi:hypothetical protein
MPQAGENEMSLQLQYQSQYESLLGLRLFYIKRLEELSTQISNLKRDARKDGVVLER